MTVCNIPSCEAHYGCRLKNKGLQVSPRVHPAHGGNWRPTVTPPNKWRGQIMYDERPGGTKMPMLKPDGNVLRRHEYERNRHKYDSIMRSHNDTNAATSRGS